MGSKLLAALIALGAGALALSRVRRANDGHGVSDEGQDAASDEREIRALQHELNEALASGDTATLDRIWADDWVFTSAVGMVGTKAEIMENIRSGALVYKPVANEDVQARMYGKAAVMTGRLTVEGTLMGQDIGGTFRYTDVFIKRGGRWQVVAEQSTQIVQFQ